MVTLVAAALDDVELLTEIIVDAFRDEVRLYGRGPRGYDSVERRRKAMEAGVKYFKIVADGELAGVISASMRGPDCRIGVAAVRLALQGKGIGTEAMRLLEREFPGVKRFFLETPARSFRNQHVYAGLGYRKFKEEVEDPATGFTLFHMEKLTGGYGGRG